MDLGELDFEFVKAGDEAGAGADLTTSRAEACAEATGGAEARPKGRTAITAFFLGGDPKRVGEAIDVLAQAGEAVYREALGTDVADGVDVRDEAANLRTRVAQNIVVHFAALYDQLDTTSRMDDAPARVFIPGVPFVTALTSNLARDEDIVRMVKLYRDEALWLNDTAISMVFVRLGRAPACDMWDTSLVSTEEVLDYANAFDPRAAVEAAKVRHQNTSS